MERALCELQARGGVRLSGTSPEGRPALADAVAPGFRRRAGQPTGGQRVGGAPSRRWALRPKAPACANLG